MPNAVDIQAFLHSLGELESEMQVVTVDAVGEFSAAVLGEAQFLCPKKTGTLAASGFQEEVSNQGGLITCTIGFNTEYAVFVHERLDLKHLPPTRSKFLEAAMGDYNEQFYPYVKAKLDAALQKNRG